MTAARRHPCACCGHLTLDTPGDRSDQICPVCFWEHSDPAEDLWNGSNAVTLQQAQRNFEAFGAAERALIDGVRAPHADEPRDPDFLPWDQARQREAKRVQGVLRTAFAGVQLDGGTTLHEAELIDDYGLDTERNDPIRNLPYTTWEALPRPVLERFRPTSFFDARGVRFHLPAYMALALEDADGDLVHWLTPPSGELADWWEGKFSLIDADQAAAILAFLHFIRRYGDAVFADDTLPAIAYWQERAGDGSSQPT